MSSQRKDDWPPTKCPACNGCIQHDAEGFWCGGCQYYHYNICQYPEERIIEANIRTELEVME